jgi:hypothetical protein
VVVLLLITVVVLQRGDRRWGLDVDVMSARVSTMLLWSP